MEDAATASATVAVSAASKRDPSKRDREAALRARVKELEASLAAAKPQHCRFIALFAISLCAMVAPFFFLYSGRDVKKLLFALSPASSGSSSSSSSSSSVSRVGCSWSSLAWDTPERLVSWTVSGNASNSSEVSLALKVQGCDLGWVERDRSAVKACLSRLGHVALVGDSVTRLQFLSLTHFLHTGSWKPLDGGPPGDAPRAWAEPGSDSA